MNKAELIDELARKLGTDRQEAAALLRATVDQIVWAVHAGDSVTITGFGVFERRSRRVRDVHNPRTGQHITQKVALVPVFRPGGQFKAIVSGAQRLPPEAPVPRRDVEDGRGPGDVSAAAAATSPAVAGDRRPAVHVVAVDTVHPEQALATESTAIQRITGGPAIQREARLTERFQQYLEAGGHQVMRYRITPAGKPPIYSDLADTTDNVVYEAKGSADRMSVRLALGQVLDYGRFIEGSRLAVLLPERPADDLVDLLEQCGVGCVIETAPATFRDLTTLAVLSNTLGGGEFSHKLSLEQ
ncbi:MAG: HU family DNA-binding protein [Gammaproteobacteria bacterium]|nr:MAG: HU family DNA-binding protein [Gammaproteobacteria bacterium]